MVLLIDVLHVHFDDKALPAGTDTCTVHMTGGSNV